MENELKRKKQTTKQEQEKLQRWVRAMEVGARTGCHQRPERSFFIKGYQFPVCARCTGVFLGYLAAPVVYAKVGFAKLKGFAIGGLLLMFIDWLLQALHIKESTNGRRLITGILGGFGSMVVFLKLLSILFAKVKAIVKYVI